MTKKDLQEVKSHALLARLELQLLNRPPFHRGYADYVPAKILADHWGVGVDTIYRWSKLGYLHPKSVRRRLRFSFVDVFRLATISRCIWQAMRRRLPAEQGRTWQPTCADDWR
jgi:hypothetical protein